MNGSSLEVESRAFVSREEFERLKCELNGLLGHVEPVRQITFYLDHPMDTRIQFERVQGKIWQKFGEMHQTERREVEVYLERNQTASLLEILQNLGHAIEIAWYRERRTYFQGGNRKICLDETAGYGLIVEIEIMTDTEGLEAAKRGVREYLLELGVEPTPKAIFDSAFLEYKEKWREVTKGLGWAWLEG